MIEYILSSRRHYLWINCSKNIFSFTDGAGNNLCGPPLNKCPPSKKKSVPTVAIIVAAVGATALAVIVITLLLFHRRNRRKAPKVERLGSTKNEKKEPKYKYDHRTEIGLPKHTADNYKKTEQAGELHFVRNGTERFELQDLLRASAEVLGSGSFGSSYKAILLSGPAMVVKRYKQMSNVGKEDFYEHMRKLGSLSHPNLLPLVAFYYKKEEKLLVTDFAENGSLASHLHGKLILYFYLLQDFHVVHRHHEMYTDALTWIKFWRWL